MTEGLSVDHECVAGSCGNVTTGREAKVGLKDTETETWSRGGSVRSLTVEVSAREWASLLILAGEKMRTPAGQASWLLSKTLSDYAGRE